MSALLPVTEGCVLAVVKLVLASCSTERSFPLHERVFGFSLALLGISADLLCLTILRGHAGRDLWLEITYVDGCPLASSVKLRSLSL